MSPFEHAAVMFSQTKRLQTLAVLVKWDRGIREALTSLYAYAVVVRCRRNDILDPLVLSPLRNREIQAVWFIILVPSDAASTSDAPKRGYLAGACIGTWTDIHGSLLQELRCRTRCVLLRIAKSRSANRCELLPADSRLWKTVVFPISADQQGLARNG